MSKEEAIKELEKQIEIQQQILNKGSNYRFLFDEARIMIQIYQLAIACLSDSEVDISGYDVSVDEAIERLEKLKSDLNRDITPENSSASAYGKVEMITEALRISVDALKDIKVVKSQYSEEEEIKKAIRHFQSMADDAQVVLDTGFGSHAGESNLVYRNRKKYAKLAVEALNKQLTKKPNGIRYVDYYCGENLFNFTCPNCGRHYSRSYPANYCECGQHLDWRGEI